MARGRMISATLGESRRFAALPDGDTRMLYMLIVANADKAGRVEADPLYVTRKILTRLPHGHEFVERALQDLADVGLIILYEAGGLPYLQVTKFHEHNSPHHKEADSRIPPPSGYQPDGKPEEGTEPPPIKQPSSATQAVQDDGSQARSKHGASMTASTGQASRMLGENKREENEVEENQERTLEPPQGSKVPDPSEAAAPGEGRVGPDGAAPPTDSFEAEVKAELQARIDEIMATSKSHGLKDGLIREARKMAERKLGRGGKPTMLEHYHAVKAAKAEGREPPPPPGLLA